MTYCTGGVRCETAGRYLSTRGNVFMLSGGIHAYLEWVKDQPVESLFTGVNYVFDARKTYGGNGIAVVCWKCGAGCDTYTKCSGCHVVVPVCCDPVGLCCEQCDGKGGCYCSTRLKDAVSI